MIWQLDRDGTEYRRVNFVGIMRQYETITVMTPAPSADTGRHHTGR